MSGAKRKPAAREVPSDAAALELFQQYGDIMRDAGSPNGAWNPDPDEHTLAMVRTDVSLSPNETKAIFGVKAHCLRHNPIKGRTAWGWTETGKPFRVTELAAYFGWDEANTLKWIRRPLEYGFIRRNDEGGQLGIGAWVRGTPGPDPEVETPSEVDLLVCTDKLPRYLAEAVCSQLTESQKVSFLEGWRSIRTDSQQKLNTQKQRIYEQEQRQLDQHCKAFAQKLPSLKRKGAKDAPKQDGSHLSVQTSNDDFVQDGDAPLYKASGESVQTPYIRNQRKAVNSDDSSLSAGRQAFEDVPAGLPEGLRKVFPLDEISDDAIAKLHARLRTELGDYDVEPFLRMVERRVCKAPVKEPVSPGLVFTPNGIASDFCKWVTRLRRCEQVRLEPKSHRDDPALARWRKEQEAALSDPGVSEQEKNLIRLCLGLDEPRAKAKGAHA